MGMTAITTLTLLAGYGPIESRAGRLLQIETAPSPAGAPAASAPEASAPAAPAPAEAGAAAPALESLTATDRDLLTKVRLAGLWEIPAGRMAAEKGVNPQVRLVGQQIADQHVKLDAQVVSAARRVHLLLPDRPNSDQQFWLDEMERATGPEFDRIFVDRLRAAHGKVFPAVAAVRVGTRNPVVRGLASSANDFVLNHLTLLESTRLVDWGSLPPPPEVTVIGGAMPPSEYRPWKPAPGQPVRYTAAWAVLGLAAVVGFLGLLRLLSPRLFGHGLRRVPLAEPMPRALDELPRRSAHSRSHPSSAPS